MSDGRNGKASVGEGATNESGRPIWCSNVNNGALLLGKGRACTTWSANGWNTRADHTAYWAVPTGSSLTGHGPRQKDQIQRLDALSRLGRRLASAVAFSLPLGEADGLEDDGELE
ncbi:hypothetical protein TGAM01_v200797 [Trichoderma gamsii]|uniref:Uncharacterized protein n=1 Tax=Trichoderma gamsii TaxID=398673 RepID=A0A2P5A1D6_9HYPO|nr:hypothetical protein TGAM01_v200797 [Trichoderma gamsii]PON30357.1 hypothetical protein TGAM01_v200797 [Trichoderma gamsii]